MDDIYRNPSNQLKINKEMVKILKSEFLKDQSLVFFVEKEKYPQNMIDISVH